MEKNTICSNMDGPEIITSKVSQTKTNITWYHLYVESKTNDYKWTYLWNRNGLTDVENIHMVTNGEVGEEKTKFGINRHTLLYVK